ncbi:acyltransferase [Mucilaginibacter sp. L3T2-6]|uniref:acyltransferase family protein n=1 Tax=Mucilaginibacter sp. L3T2-6 TaxID=3062491 RepID=UPI002674F90D|nr:acyltransferase [Mucilaginibacter sp. L3T2-6]MDO3640526.1 acyltransferase [Mucilaginibacter sp. L3T2-6]MDV6213135.1 acyltransferase [Mucilaginibacter sp. L3T2-6]
MKPHYPILDGLRGTAAILVVIYHLLEAYFGIPVNHPMHHGYLAVDFFFMLSGFVIGYAYDDRWAKGMTVWEFFKIRLVRLHPLVIAGVLIGAIGFYFDPYTNGMAHTSILKLIGVTLISFTLLPSPDVRGWGETHPLDGPCWSLLQEYIANVLYALVGRFMSKSALWVVIIISAGAVVYAANYHGDLGTGWGYDTFWIAVVRMVFPFFAGLLLFRTGKLIRIPMAYTVCSVILLILFFIPTYSFNGYYEAAIVIFVFPVIVSAGAGGKIDGRWAKLCKFSGAISYPIYILHYPFIYIYTAWIANEKPAPSQIVPVACGLFVFFILLAYAGLKLYDEPVREWLKKHWLKPRIHG